MLCVQSKSKIKESTPPIPFKTKVKGYAASGLKAIQEAWGGLEKTFGSLRSAMNARMQLKPPLKESHVITMKNGINGMKLFAVLNLPLHAIELPGVAKDISESVKLKDKEGVALSAMTFAILTADMYDSLTMVINASLALSSKPALGGVVAVIGTPVVMGMIGLASVTKGIHLWNIRKFDKEISQLMQDKISESTPTESREAILEFVNHKLGTMVRKTKRDTDAKTIELLQAIKQKVETTEKLEVKDIAEIRGAVKKIRDSIGQTKKILKWTLVAFSIMLVAFSMFYLTIPLAIPFALLAVGFAIRLGVWAYQRHLAKKRTEALAAT